MIFALAATLLLQASPQARPVPAADPWLPVRFLTSRPLDSPLKYDARATARSRRLDSHVHEGEHDALE
jgi:hypothetical protein